MNIYSACDIIADRHEFIEIVHIIYAISIQA
jgi:hypothetical protein